jgi:Putative adhesin
MAEFDCPNPITVSVRLAAGSVDVVAEERSTAVVDVEPYDGSDDSRDAAARTRVEMHGNTLTVTAPETGPGWGRRRSSRLRVDIRVPLDSSVDLRAASAALNCHGRFATARLGTASGDCQIERVTGDLSVDTASGSVRVGTVDGDLRVKGASSDMSVEHVGGDARLDSASGSIEINQADGSVRAETASGTVRLGRVRRGTVRVDAVSGVVSVGVVAGTGVWLDLRTLSGATTSDLHVGGDAPPTGHDLELRVRTVSGDIEVHRVAGPPDAAEQGEATGPSDAAGPPDATGPLDDAGSPDTTGATGATPGTTGVPGAAAGADTEVGR